jgi:hypothetical protein
MFVTLVLLIWLSQTENRSRKYSAETGILRELQTLTRRENVTCDTVKKLCIFFCTEEKKHGYMYRAWKYLFLTLLMTLLSCIGYLSSSMRMIIRRNGILLIRRKKGLVYVIIYYTLHLQINWLIKNIKESIIIIIIIIIIIDSAHK